MEIKELIENRIKDVFGTQKKFCESIKIDPRDFARKQKSFLLKLKWIKAFLDPLCFDVVIIYKGNNVLKNLK